jgi:hypothetical protein
MFTQSNRRQGAPPVVRTSDIPWAPEVAAVVAQVLLLMSNRFKKMPIHHINYQPKDPKLFELFSQQFPQFYPIESDGECYYRCIGLQLLDYRNKLEIMCSTVEVFLGDNVFPYLEREKGVVRVREAIRRVRGFVSGFLGLKTGDFGCGDFLKELSICLRLFVGGYLMGVQEEDSLPR